MLEEVITPITPTACCGSMMTGRCFSWAGLRSATSHAQSSAHCLNIFVTWFSNNRFFFLPDITVTIQDDQQSQTAEGVLQGR